MDIWDLLYMSQVSAPSGSPHNLALGFSRPRMAVIYLVMVALVFVVGFLRPVSFFTRWAATHMTFLHCVVES